MRHSTAFLFLPLFRVVKSGPAEQPLLAQDFRIARYQYAEEIPRLAFSQEQMVGYVGARRVFERALRDGLDRDIPVGEGIVPEINAAGRALAQFAKDVVLADPVVARRGLGSGVRSAHYAMLMLFWLLRHDGLRQPGGNATSRRRRVSIRRNIL